MMDEIPQSALCPFVQPSQTCSCSFYVDLAAEEEKQQIRNL